MELIRPGRLLDIKQTFKLIIQSYQLLPFLFDTTGYHDQSMQLDSIAYNSRLGTQLKENDFSWASIDTDILKLTYFRV